jgi:uracil-DNA glycosylase
MIGPVVTGEPAVSKILLIGQAPGDKEGAAGKPFAWTAGKTLFKWFESIGVEEKRFRSTVYMAAVCRCFPGKKPKGGDRVPSDDEIEQCSQWLNKEIDLLEPELIIPVGKLAIAQFLEFKKLTDVIGHQHHLHIRKASCDLIPLPHPSGASTWHRTEPGKSLLSTALDLVAQHPAWISLTITNGAS